MRKDDHVARGVQHEVEDSGYDCERDVGAECRWLLVHRVQISSLTPFRSVCWCYDLPSARCLFVDVAIFSDVMVFS